MQREILFRGKQGHNGEWVYGTAMIWNGFAQIIRHNHMINSTWQTESFKVIPETVGQFTGSIDKNGVKIFEGDIVKYQIQLDSDDPNEIGGEVLECNHKVIFNLHGCGFEISCLDYSTINQGLYCNNYMEIIGNIHDNAELLK